jgi:uncharacterized membrane protein YukC
MAKKKKKKAIKIDFDYFRWISIGFAISSIGIAILAVLYVLTSLKK